MCASSTGCSPSVDTCVAGGRRPGRERLIVDVDSFIGQAYGKQKEGVGFGYTRQRGYHPLLASRAGTGEVLHVRLRNGQANTQRGVVRFAEELIARVARAGATGEKLFRADSGFWNRKLIATARERRLALLDQRPPAILGARSDRADPRAGVAALDGLPR